jgi:hypothetical protein
MKTRTPKPRLPAPSEQDVPKGAVASYRIWIPDRWPTLASELKCHPLKAASLKARDVRKLMYANRVDRVPLVAVPRKELKQRKALGIGALPDDPRPRKRRVRFLIYGRYGALPDPDSPLKSGLDALVSAGLLVDDSERWCEWEKPVFERGTTRAYIELMDI